MPADEQVLYLVRGRVLRAESGQKCEGKKIGWGSGWGRLK